MTSIAYALLAVASSGSPPPEDYAQLTIRQRIIIRIPAQTRADPPTPYVRLREKKGPKCIAMRDMGGAAITGPEQVDFALKGGGRVRAKLESACPALDYYQGFYISPTADGRICADRDMIRTRMGGRCGIARFRALVPDR